MLNFVLNYTRFQDDQKINVNQELGYMRSKEFVSQLDEIRKCFLVFSKINQAQEVILVLDIVIRLSLILNFFIFEEVSLLLQIGFYSCVAQTILSILSNRTIPSSNSNEIKKSCMIKFYSFLLKLLQLDKIYFIMDIRGLKKIIPNDRSLIDSRKEDMYTLHLWLYERKVFTVFRMLIFISEMYQRESASFFLVIGTMYCIVSTVVLNYIQTQAFYITLKYDLRERLFIMLELFYQYIQAFLNIVYLMGGGFYLKAISFYAIVSVIWYYLRKKYSSKFINVNSGIIENFFLGQKICYVTPLQKRDMKQFNLVADNCLNNVLYLIYFVAQLFIIKSYLLDVNQPKIIKVLQLKILAINILLLFFKIYLIRNLAVNKQSFQAEDIVIADQYRKKNSLKVYIKIKSENQLFVSEEDAQVLQEMLSCQIEEFYLGFEREFEIFSRRGNTYFKINSIRNQAEIERVFLAILNSCKSFDFEIDRDLVSLPKLDKFMHLLLKNYIFIDQLKLVMSKQQILDYFERREIDYSSFVNDFVQTCPAIIQLTCYYKYISNYLKLKPLTVLQDIGS